MNRRVVGIRSDATQTEIFVTFIREGGFERRYHYDGHHNGLISMSSVVSISRLIVQLEMCGRVVILKDDRSLLERHALYHITARRQSG